MPRYHYLVRSYRWVIPGPWAESKVYKDYILYKSHPFNSLLNMRDVYAKNVRDYHLDPNPQFFRDDEYVDNSDSVYYGFDEIDIGRKLM